MKTVVIGLGNPVRSDDAVGLRVACLVSEKMSSRPDVHVKEAYVGGLGLMEAMAGFERAIVVDAMVTGIVEPGTIQAVPLSRRPATRNLASSHDTSLPVALELGRALGLPMPDVIEVWGIEAQDVDTFSGELTEAVARSVPLAAERIVGRIAERLS
ncbi:MAG: hydrogenase maturation protease [Acidobacteriota bacterium]